jgi:hypothetical protein
MEKKDGISKRYWLPPAISNGITVILFVVLYAFIGPRTQAEEKIQENKKNISMNTTDIKVNTANIATVVRGLSTLNDKVERILNLMLQWKGEP